MAAKKGVLAAIWGGNMAGNPLKSLLSHLEGVREVRSGQFYAKCPAHTDGSPSLSIRDTGNKILVHCFAGCSPDDVLASAGLTFRDLYLGDEWKAAQEAGISTAGHEASKRINFDSLDLERTVLKVAEATMKRGETLSVEDTARIQLALDRLGYKREAS